MCIFTSRGSRQIMNTGNDQEVLPEGKFHWRHCSAPVRQCTLKDVQVQNDKSMVWLTHWGRVTHICVGRLTNIGSNDGLSPNRRQAFIWTNTREIVHWTSRNKLKWNFNHDSCILFHENPFRYVVWKMAAIVSRPPCVYVMDRFVDMISNNTTIGFEWNRDTFTIVLLHV